MKHLLTLLALIPLAFLNVSGQTPNIPNYIARNQDFVSKRATDGTDKSFAELYQEAFEQTKLLRAAYISKRENTWVPVGPMGNERLAGTGRINSITFHPTDSATFFICVAQGGIWKTTNSGQSWVSASGDLPILRTSALAIHPEKPETMYVALGDFEYLGHNIFANDNKRNTHYGMGVYKTTDGGNTWKPTGLSLKQTDYEASLLSALLINHNNPEVIIAGGQTGIYRSENGGSTWTKTNNGLIFDMKPAAHSNKVIYAAQGTVTEYNMGKAGILKSNDFGKTWIEAKVPFRKKGSVQRIELAPSKSDPAKVYALACNAAAWVDNGGGFYGLFMSKDSGVTFSTVIDSTHTNILNGALEGGVGGQGRYDLALCVNDLDADMVYTGGINLWTSINGGNYFEPSTYWVLNYQHLSMHGDIHEIKQHPLTGRIFVCHDGGLSSTMKFEQDGDSLLNGGYPRTRFIHYTKNLQITSFYRLAVHADSMHTITAGAQDNSTAIRTTQGWGNLSGGDGMESAFNEEEDLIYTSSQYGFIYEYTKLGNYYLNTDHISAPSNERAEWTTPFVVANHKIWVGYGNVYKYGTSIISDFAAASNRTYPLPSSALYVCPTNDNIIYVGKRGFYADQIDGEVWASMDGGKNWSDISTGLPLEHYPTYISANDKNPNQAWICFASWEDGKKVYTTRNGGKTWDNISYNLPNIPVNCVVYQNDESKNVYLGTDLGVYYLDSVKDEWVSYADGLPNVIVHELEVHQKSHTLKAATFGRGIWEIPLMGKTDTMAIGKLPNLKLDLYPNPTAEYLKITFVTPPNYKTEARILNIAGQVVWKGKLTNTTSSHEIDVSGFLSGQYFLVVPYGNSQISRSFEIVD